MSGRRPAIKRPMALATHFFFCLSLSSCNSIHPKTHVLWQFYLRFVNRKLIRHHLNSFHFHRIQFFSWRIILFYTIHDNRSISSSFFRPLQHQLLLHTIRQTICESMSCGGPLHTYAKSFDNACALIKYHLWQCSVARFALIPIEINRSFYCFRIKINYRKATRNVLMAMNQQLTVIL